MLKFRLQYNYPSPSTLFCLGSVVAHPYASMSAACCDIFFSPVSAIGRVHGSPSYCMPWPQLRQYDSQQHWRSNEWGHENATGSFTRANLDPETDADAAYSGVIGAVRLSCPVLCPPSANLNAFTMQSAINSRIDVGAVSAPGLCA